MADLTPGDMVPEVTLETPDGGTLSLASLRGKAFVLYFYPRDDTPGCTTEGLDFTRLKSAFDMAGVAVIGVSKDSAVAHRKFADKHGLTVSLATDADGSVCEAFGVWVEKNMYGKTSMGIQRATFLIDAAGKIAQVWRKVKVPGHADAVLAAAEALTKA